ncbi:MAG: hypothetical protein UDN39_06325 [Christensenellales bacterium]|nr:hypothetical protein [Christensenellales bacterium]
MKRFVGMMGALLLVPTLALASGDMVSISELHQQVEMMGRWTKTYDTPNGEVSVDIPIIVPEVENVPILQVSAVMGKDVAEEKKLHKSVDQENAGAGIFYDDFDILSKLNVDVDGAAMIFCANPKEIDLAFLQVNLDEPLAKRLGNWDYSSDYYYPNEMNPEILFAEENDQPLSAAEDVLAVLLQDYYGSENADYGVDYVEVRGRARKRVGRTKNDLGAYKKDYPKGTYYISFRQKLEGIPIYLEIGHKMLTTNQTYVTQEVALKCQRIRGIETNTLEYMDETSFILDTTWMREEKRIQEDVPLATLEDVMRALEKRIEEGYIRDIYALRLGYVCYLDDTSPDIYALYPAWICDCIYANSPREQIMENIVTDAFRENYRYEQILVDAQTCDIQEGWIDRDEGLYHTEPMTWGKIQ